MTPDEQDTGLARERTRLSWRRTALAMAAGSVGAGKLLEGLVGPAAWTLTLAGLVGSALVVVAAMRRHTVVVSPVHLGGRLVTIVSATLAAIGVVAVAAVAAQRVTF